LKCSSHAKDYFYSKICTILFNKEQRALRWKNVGLFGPPSPVLGLKCHYLLETSIPAAGQLWNAFYVWFLWPVQTKNITLLQKYIGMLCYGYTVLISRSPLLWKEKSLPFMLHTYFKETVLWDFWPSVFPLNGTPGSPDSWAKTVLNIDSNLQKNLIQFDYENWLHFVSNSAESHSAELHSAELHSAELHSAELHSTELHSTESHNEVSLLLAMLHSAELTPCCVA
jgi:hypothetical protein